LIQLSIDFDFSALSNTICLLMVLGDVFLCIFYRLASSCFNLDQVAVGRSFLERWLVFQKHGFCLITNYRFSPKTFWRQFICWKKEIIAI